MYCEKLGYDVCVVQVIGKNSFSEFEAQYLLKHTEMLRAFSHTDVETITRIAENIKINLIKKTCKIREIHTHNITKKDVIIIEQMGDPQKLRATSLQEIQNNKTLLNKFNPDEAFQLGYMKATQDIEKEQAAIKKIKMKNSAEKLIDIKIQFQLNDSVARKTNE